MILLHRDSAKGFGSVGLVSLYIYALHMLLGRCVDHNHAAEQYNTTCHVAAIPPSGTCYIDIAAA
jgi:hypothetical protein